MPKTCDIRVADEVWIAAAALHRRHPQAQDFSVAEVIGQAQSASITGEKPLRPGVRSHVYLHCVANRPPNLGRYRTLVETASGRRRLYRCGDPCHPERTSGKSRPQRHEIPAAYHELIDWYETVFTLGPPSATVDPLLALRGTGREVWADEAADTYVRRLRAGRR